MPTPRNNLQNQRVLVTGATSGIGRAIALQLAGDGAEVFAHGRDAARGADTVAAMSAAGGRARLVAADLGHPAEVQRLAREIGHIDVLVNNAGLALLGPTADLAGDRYDALLASNVGATYRSLLEKADPLNSVPAHAASAPAPVRDGRLPDALAFVLLASIILAFLAGSSAPTPLYTLYQAAWGFSPITTTIMFGVYALGVLAALLTVGSLSDYVGRRPVLLVAIALQAVVMLIFITAGGVPQMLVARLLQGLSTGAAAGAIGAGLLDLDKARGTIANAVGPCLGTATGSIRRVVPGFWPARGDRRIPGGASRRGSAHGSGVRSGRDRARAARGA